MAKTYFASAEVDELACVFSALCTDFHVEGAGAQERLAKAIMRLALAQAEPELILVSLGADLKKERAVLGPLKVAA